MRRRLRTHPSSRGSSRRTRGRRERTRRSRRRSTRRKGLHPRGSARARRTSTTAFRCMACSGASGCSRTRAGCASHASLETRSPRRPARCASSAARRSDPPATAYQSHAGGHRKWVLHRGPICGGNGGQAARVLSARRSCGCRALRRETDGLLWSPSARRVATPIRAVAVHGAAAGFDERPTRLLGHLFVEIFLGGSLAGRRGLHGFLAELLREVVVFRSRNERFPLCPLAL